MTRYNQNRVLVVLAVVLMVGGVWLMWPSVGVVGDTATEPSVKFVAPAPEVVAKTKPAPKESAAATKRVLETRVNWEEERLAQLQKSYAEVNSRKLNADFVNRQVQTLTDRLMQTQKAIGDREAEKMRIDEAAQAAQRRVKVASNDEQIAIENQIASITARISSLNEDLRSARQSAATASATPPAPAAPAVVPSSLPAPSIYTSDTPSGTITGVAVPTPTTVPVGAQGPNINSIERDIQTQIAQLEAQRAQLSSTLRTAALSAENAAISAVEVAQTDKDLIRAEQENLNRLHADLTTELDYWKRQQAAVGDEGSRTERLQVLRNQVQEQEKQVSTLRRQLGTFR